MSKKQVIIKIQELVENGYAETHVGYHADYRMWNGYERRGCYAQIAETHGGTTRIYARSYEELYVTLLTDYIND